MHLVALRQHQQVKCADVLLHALSCYYSLRPLACTFMLLQIVFAVAFAVPDRAMCFPLTAPGFSTRFLPIFCQANASLS